MAKQADSTELPVPSVLIQPWELESFEESIKRGNHYALLDACNEPAVLGMVEIHSAVDCLYQGQSAEDFSAIAPYLFELDLPLLTWFKDQLIEKPCGVFFESQLDRTSLRMHLRRLLKVEVPNDRQFYFRFYDPRVLPGFLETAEQKVVAEFFGPIKACFYFDQSQIYRISPRSTLVSPDNGEMERWPVGYRISVSQDHLQAMDRYSKKKFSDRLETHLAEALPEQDLKIPKVKIQKRVAMGMHNAEHYCLHTEQHIATYIELMCVGFPDHEQKTDPGEVRGLMLDRRLAIEDRLQRLRAMVTE